MRLLLAICLTVLVPSLVATPEASAANRGRGRGSSSAAHAAQRRKMAIGQLQGQLAAAKNVLAQAESAASAAQADAATGIDKVRASRDSMIQTNSDLKQLRTDWKTAESEALASADPKSEFATAHTAYEDVKKRLQEAERRIDTDRDLKKTIADLPESDDRAAKVAEIWAKAKSEDHAYTDALIEMKETRLKYQRARDAAMSENAAWKSARQAVHDADMELLKLDNEAKAGALHAMPAKRRMREANATAAEARAIIASSEAMLMQLGVKPAAPPKTSPSSSSQNK